MKPFLFFIHIVMILMIDNNITSAQYINPPRGDYILHNCIASVVLMRNHRKSQLPALNAGENNYMISNGNVIERKEVLTNRKTQIAQRNGIWRGRERTGFDTPLKTIDIKKGRTRELIFMKKDHFPEVLPSHYKDDGKEKNAKIIVIKSTNRNNS